MDSTMIMLMLACLLLFGGQIKIGDQTLLQLIVSLIGGIFKPTPAAGTAATQPGQYGGILDLFEGLLSNPMVLIALMVGVMMLTGGGGCGMSGCSLIPKSEGGTASWKLTPREVTPAVWPGESSGYSGSHYADVQRLHLISMGGGDQVMMEQPWQLYAEPADLRPALPAPMPLACSGASCSGPQTIRSATVYRARNGFWGRGPVRRIVAWRPLRRLQPLRRVGRAVRWLVRR